jgi:hypothetical protein
VKVLLNRGEHDKKAGLMRDLSAQGFDITDKETIHASILNKFASDQVEEGNILPDVFNVRPFRSAHITKYKGENL